MTGHEAQVRAVLERHTEDLLAPAARDEKVARRAWGSLRRDLRALGFGWLRTWWAVRKVKSAVARRQHKVPEVDFGAEVMGGLMELALGILLGVLDG
ncbi:MAG: hypothetical protein QOD77_1932 [Thermoplasmata archaeon]|jgi:hypothetical protein|nr:hypothetical protein [Thermoplasmata archaeon]